MVLDNERGKGCAQREKGQRMMMMMMKQMPRTLSHVIDVHHRVRRKLNIARRHINIYIYTPGRAMLMRLSFFSPLIAGNRGARFVFASLSSIAISFSSSSSFSSFLFFFFSTQRTTPRVIHCDGTPLPLVFRSSLNKQAPIKVPGVYSTSGSRDHQSRRICEAL